MVVFYNVIGILNLVLAAMALRCASLTDKDSIEFKVACKALCAVFILIAVAFFTSQFEQRLEQGTFQRLNPFMLILFYSIGHGVIYILLTLFRTKEANKYIKHTIPIYILFILYTIAFFIFGDTPLYSLSDLVKIFPHSPMLMFRCLLLLSCLSSIIYGLIVCHRECRKNNKRVSNSFCELEFQRNVVVSKFMWNIKALTIWSILTYFLSTIILEIVSCSLITIVFAIQIIGFRGFFLSRNASILRVLTTSGEMDFEIDKDAVKLKQKLKKWAERADKPYTHSSITISEVARDIGISKNKLSIHINSTKSNFRSWINNLRIEEAKLLLITKKELPISEIADLIGFCDLPAFSRAFKNTTGVTPKSFRNDQTQTTNTTISKP